MSKSSLLAGSVGGLIGAVLGGGVMLALRPAPAAIPPPTTAEMRAAFADALAPMVDEIRTNGASALRSTHPRVGPTGTTPPPNFARVRELQDFEEDISVRQRWLFLSESHALATFGTPTSLWLSDNGECWRYDEPDVETGNEIIRGASFTLVFNRGRLVQVYD